MATTFEAAMRPDAVGYAAVKPFKNEPLTDFTRDENIRAMQRAITRVQAQLGREYDLVIGGDRKKTKEKIVSTNPADPQQVIGTFQKAGVEHAEPAIQAALKAYESWSRTTPRERAEVLFRVADIIRRRKFEFSAWMVYEVGKNWWEADGDTAEMIDFAEYYGREALRLADSRPDVQLAGEWDQYWYVPLGVGAVIPPWNFPLAIMAGMTMASIVCGNTVVLKPSSESPAISAQFFEALIEAGMPAGVVNFCPGGGGSFGNAVVEHPKTRFIAFTGSKEVGLDIHARAAQSKPGQIWIKRTVLEMGGKDSILIDHDADLDAAVEGVALSAFGFQGQKCSAASRAIIDERIYEMFIERLRERVKQISIGPPTENYSFGPVVSKSAMEGHLRYIEIGRREGRLVLGGDRIAGMDGYYIHPTIIADVDPMARVSQEEIFGPVLAVLKCRGFEDGLRIANNTEFGLTGAYYSSSQEKIGIAKREFHVGNLYINRKSTGAVVGAHPFGGFNMSGTNSKAGGPDYLYLFSQGKSIGEKVGAGAKIQPKGEM